MNINSTKVYHMLKVGVATLTISSFVLLNALTAVKAETRPVVVNVKNHKEETEKLITNVKASYNPVVGQILVSFNLAKQSAVTIKLMDALGNEVLNLYNGTLEEGTNSHVFETVEKINPGFYFLRVASGAETVVKRISIK